jgi:hypothetical protein
MKWAAITRRYRPGLRCTDRTSKAQRAVLQSYAVITPV